MSIKLDDLLSMAAYAHVVEAKSFTAAAAKLGLSKSVVSSRLSELEARLGVRLLHRTTRRLSLTTEGARLYERCARILRAAEDADCVIADVGTLPQGLLRVTAPIGFGLLQLAELLPAFAERYPDVRLDVSLSDRILDIASEGFDVAIRVASRLRESNLVARRLGTDRLILCAAPSYLARRPGPRTPHELTQHNCLQLFPVRQSYEWSFQAPGGPLVVSVSGNLNLDNVVALRTALLGGHGIAVMPQSVILADLKRGRLVPLLENHPMQEMGVYALHVVDRAHPLSRSADRRARRFEPCDFLARVAIPHDDDAAGPLCALRSDHPRDPEIEKWFSERDVLAVLQMLLERKPHYRSPPLPDAAAILPFSCSPAQVPIV